MRLMRCLSLVSLLVMLALAACSPEAPAVETQPIVRILQPGDGGMYPEGAEVTLQAEGSDEGSGVARLVLYLDDVRLSEALAPNAEGQPAFTSSFTWMAAEEGPHELKVVAYRADGTASEPDRILLAVLAPTATTEPTPLPTVTPLPTETATEVPPSPTPTQTLTRTPTRTVTPQAGGAGAASTSAPASESGNRNGDDDVVLIGTTIVGTNVRQGPGLDYPVAFTLLADAAVEVIGRDYIQGWYHVRHDSDPDSPGGLVREGWIFFENIRLSGDGAQLPIEQVAAAPTSASAPPTAAPGDSPGQGESAPPQPAQPSTAALLALPNPIPGEGRELCQNPNMDGPQVHYYNWLNGVSGWWLEEYVGVTLTEGGEPTQGVQSQWRDPGNVVLIGYYLLGQYGSTAVEMGGTWRTFSWATGQSDVPVQAGRQYTLEAVLTPFVNIMDDSGQEVWASAANSPDWAGLFQWRWVVTGSDGTTIADYWRNGASLGTQTWELNPSSPHIYRFSFAANQNDSVTVSLQFQNRWPIAVSKVWLHAAHCYEF